MLLFVFLCLFSVIHASNLLHFYTFTLSCAVLKKSIKCGFEWVCSMRMSLKIIPTMLNWWTSNLGCVPCDHNIYFLIPSGVLVACPPPHSFSLTIFTASYIKARKKIFQKIILFEKKATITLWTIRLWPQKRNIMIFKPHRAYTWLNWSARPEFRN